MDQAYITEKDYIAEIERFAKVLAHRKKVKSAATASLVQFGIDKHVAEKVVRLISFGCIDSTMINY